RAAASRARDSSREAIAAISQRSAACIPGITFPVAMSATPRTPHFTLRMMSSLNGARSRLYTRRAALGLPRQHPAGIFGFERADRVERRELFGRQRQVDGGEIVVELLDGLGADDHAHHPLALKEPGERDT